MIRDLCLKENFACIHAVTPFGGGGKSIHNREKIDIYNRFNFNIYERKGIATSIFKNSSGFQKKFGAQGLIIYDGSINNANCSDAGSCFNDITGKWETTEGTNDPSINQTIEEINKANGSYVELNIYDYKICGFFIDFTEEQWLITSIRSFGEFYKKTIGFNLPYYGLSYHGIVKIKLDVLKTENWNRIQEGTLIEISDIYSSDAIVI